MSEKGKQPGKAPTNDPDNSKALVAKEKASSEPLDYPYGENSENRLLGGCILSRLFFQNFTKVINAGVKKPFTNDMLFKMESKFTYEGDYPQFKKYYEKYEESHKDDYLAIITGYIYNVYFPGIVLTGITYMTNVAFPITLKYFIKWISDDEDAWKGFAIGGFMVFLLLVQVLSNLWGYLLIESCTLIIKNLTRVSDILD